MFRFNCGKIRGSKDRGILLGKKLASLKQHLLVLWHKRFFVVTAIISLFLLFSAGIFLYLGNFGASMSFQRVYTDCSYKNALPLSLGESVILSRFFLDSNLNIYANFSTSKAGSVMVKTGQTGYDSNFTRIGGIIDLGPDDKLYSGYVSSGLGGYGYLYQFSSTGEKTAEARVDLGTEYRQNPYLYTSDFFVEDADQYVFVLINKNTYSKIFKCFDITGNPVSSCGIDRYKGTEIPARVYSWDRQAYVDFGTARFSNIREAGCNESSFIVSKLMEVVKNSNFNSNLNTNNNLNQNGNDNANGNSNINTNDNANLNDNDNTNGNENINENDNSNTIRVDSCDYYLKNIEFSASAPDGLTYNGVLDQGMHSATGGFDQPFVNEETDWYSKLFNSIVPDKYKHEYRSQADYIINNWIKQNIDLTSAPWLDQHQDECLPESRYSCELIPANYSGQVTCDSWEATHLYSPDIWPQGGPWDGESLNQSLCFWRLYLRDRYVSKTRYSSISPIEKAINFDLREISGNPAYDGWYQKNLDLCAPTGLNSNLNNNSNINGNGNSNSNSNNGLICPNTFLNVNPNNFDLYPF